MKVFAEADTMEAARELCYAIADVRSKAEQDIYIRKAAKALELDVPIIVESEGLNPTGAEENARCFEFLRKYHESH